MGWRRNNGNTHFDRTQNVVTSELPTHETPPTGRIGIWPLSPFRQMESFL